jgi:hypothetical protein
MTTAKIVVDFRPPLSIVGNRFPFMLLIQFAHLLGDLNV